MDENFLNKIKDDLIKSGFGSELKAIKIFENHNFMTVAGKSYFDKDEEKLREIDIVGMNSFTTKFRDVKYDYYIFNNLYFSAEVKKSEKPWVVFKSTYSDSFFRFFSKNKRIELNNTNDAMLYREIEDELNDDFILKINGVHESFKSPNNTSKWYGACLTAVKSISELYLENNEEKDSELKRFENKYEHYQPLVILDGKLVSAEIDDNHDVKLEEVKYAKIDVNLHTKKYPSETFSVDIVTLDALDEYLTSIKKEQNLITKALIKLEKFDKGNCKSWYSY